MDVEFIRGYKMAYRSKFQNLSDKKCNEESVPVSEIQIIDIKNEIAKADNLQVDNDKVGLKDLMPFLLSVPNPNPCLVRSKS